MYVEKEVREGRREGRRRRLVTWGNLVIHNLELLHKRLRVMLQFIKKRLWQEAGNSWAQEPAVEDTSVRESNFNVSESCLHLPPPPPPLLFSSPTIPSSCFLPHLIQG